MIWNKNSRLPAWIGALLLLFLQQSAWADVWGFIDTKGVAHFATERVDERYELFFKGGEGFDTARGVKGPIDTPRPVALPAAPTKLIAFFEVSPSFKAVKHLMREASAAQNIDSEAFGGPHARWTSPAATKPCSPANPSAPM